MPTAIAILGATGRMGTLVRQAIAEADDLVLGPTPGRGDFAPGCFEGADLVIDFSLPAGLLAALPHLGSRPLVSGTTGLSEAEQRAVDGHARQAPVLQAANFSPGVTLLLDLVERAAAALPDADLEIVEAHHRHKRDAPSGTALALGEAAARGRNQDLAAVARHGREGHTGERPAGEIGFHALRAGGIVGEHEVWLATGQERIRLSHGALSRAVFADGAIRAARWLSGRAPGHYDMRQVLFSS